jgi:hypothetical protein
LRMIDESFMTSDNIEYYGVVAAHTLHEIKTSFAESSV